MGCFTWQRCLVCGTSGIPHTRVRKSPGVEFFLAVGSKIPSDVAMCSTAPQHRDGYVHMTPKADMKSLADLASLFGGLPALRKTSPELESSLLRMKRLHTPRH